MQHYFSNAFTVTTSAHTASIKNLDSLHVGSGSPSFLPSFYRKDEDENSHSSCSSVCSAASTVASAVCSIGDSISFPASSETSYDLTTRLNFEFSCEREHAPASKRPCSANRGWKHSAYESERDWRSDGSFHIFVERKRCIKSSDKSGPESSLRVYDESVLEEFSLGSGSPFASDNYQLKPC